MESLYHNDLWLVIFLSLIGLALIQFSPLQIYPFTLLPYLLLFLPGYALIAAIKPHGGLVGRLMIGFLLGLLLFLILVIVAYLNLSSLISLLLSILFLLVILFSLVAIIRRRRTLKNSEGQMTLDESIRLMKEIKRKAEDEAPEEEEEPPRDEIPVIIVEHDEEDKNIKQEPDKEEVEKEEPIPDKVESKPSLLPTEKVATVNKAYPAIKESKPKKSEEKYHPKKDFQKHNIVNLFDEARREREENKKTEPLKKVKTDETISSMNFFRGLKASFQGKSRLKISLSILLIIVLILAISATVYIIIKPIPGEKFTEFYILGPDGTASNYPTNLTAGQQGKVIIGVVNHEYTTLNYQLVVKMNNNTLKNETISLQNNEKREIVFNFTANPIGQDKLEFLLYKLPDSQNVYRSLHLWIT